MGEARKRASTRAILIVGVFAGLTFGFGAGASATPLHRHHIVHHVWHRHVVVHRVVAGPAYVPSAAYREGLEEDSPEDGLAIGRETPVPGPNDLGPGIASTSPYGYEIEGPPISPSLPDLPVLTPELIR